MVCCSTEILTFEVFVFVVLLCRWIAWRHLQSAWCRWQIRWPTSSRVRSSSRLTQTRSRYPRSSTSALCAVQQNVHFVKTPLVFAILAVGGIAGVGDAEAREIVDRQRKVVLKRVG
jgi:hypothetical protein